MLTAIPRPRSTAREAKITPITTHVADIAWETEVWIASDPDHLIHFNGEKFLGSWEAEG